MMKKLSLFCWMLGFSVFAFGQKIEFFMIDLPEKVLEGTSRISILDFEDLTGRCSKNKGRLLGEYLTSEVLKENRGIRNTGMTFFSSGEPGMTYLSGVKTNIISVVERTDLEKVLQEQKLSNSGLIDDGQAAEIGRILGIEAIVTGTYTCNSNDEQTKEEYTDLEGKKHVSNCTKRTVNVEVRMKIVSVNSAQLIGNKDVKTNMTERKCDDQRSGLTSVELLTERCLRSAAEQLADYFTPHFVPEMLELEKIKTKEFKERAKEAVDFTEAGNFSAAYSIYKSILDMDMYNAQAAYNMGCLYYISGNFEKANEFWQMASEIDQETFGGHPAKALRRIEEEEKRTKLGIQIIPGEFTAKKDALTDKVKTRGSKGDRFNVRQKPDAGSEVIARIPGDTEFSVIEHQGAFVLIKLPGGKQGYISTKDIK
jgi:hypothetical protein